MANLKSVTFSVFFSIFLFHYMGVDAQAVQPKLSAEEMTVTIDSINSILLKNYIFPEVANKMAQSLNANLKKGAYNSLGFMKVVSTRRIKTKVE